MPIEYDAQILKLRLPEQDQLKNDAECCSADPAALKLHRPHRGPPNSK